MALLDLYFDTISKQLGYGPNGPLGASLPTLGEEEIISTSFTALKRTSLNAISQFEIQVLTGWALRIAVGSANNVLAQQNTFTLNEANTKLLGLLNLNTAGISALADGSATWFEILLTDSLGANYRKRFDVRVQKGVFVSGSIVTPPGDIALGTLAADRIYLRKQGRAGEGLILTSEDGTKQGFCYWHNDGSFRGEAIT